MDEEELVFRLALEIVPGIGPRSARMLISAFGSATGVFSASRKAILGVDRIGPFLANAIRDAQTFDRARDELNFAIQNRVELLTFDGAGYPPLLRHTPDQPTLLFCSGQIPDPSLRYIGVVGMRKNSPRAEGYIRELIRGLKRYNVVVVSGLAYGTDYLAHRIALQEGVPTIAVLANGLKRVYPKEHIGITREIIRSGGSLLTEHFSDSAAEKVHFPRRNRIVAGLCSAVVVVESGLNGGSLITADLAFQYDREVFAYPGRIGDEHSAGCLRLIKENKAQLLTDPDDIADVLNWKDGVDGHEQLKLQLTLPPHQEPIWKALRERSPLHIDELKAMGLGNEQNLALTILEMELGGVIKSLPGNTICLSK